MQNRINISYFAYGNRDFPCLKQKTKLYIPSASVKSSASNLIQRNYLNFEPGTVKNFNEFQKMKKIKHSKSQPILSLEDEIFNKYHPEYKLYRSTNEQINELNNYLNPLKQYLYKDNPQLLKKNFFHSIQNENIKVNSRYATPLQKNNEKILLKIPPNNNLLVPNKYYIKNFNSLPKLNDYVSNSQNYISNTFLESKEAPEYLRNYDKEALKNIDDYYIKKKENIHLLSRFNNWITLRSFDKNRNHPLEKIRHGLHEVSNVAPIWMDIASRRNNNINKEYEANRRNFKCVFNNGVTRDNNKKISYLFERDQNNARPIFLRDSYEKNLLLQKTNEYK